LISALLVAMGRTIEETGQKVSGIFLPDQKSKELVETNQGFSDGMGRNAISEDDMRYYDAPVCIQKEQQQVVF
jgi:hypothetical protein